MADVIQLTDGTTTIDLNSTSATGITTERFLPPRNVRQTSRATGYPFLHGSRTVASALNDSEVEWTGHIRDVNADAMEAQYLALVRLLEQAQRWEERRTGSPVRLVYRRSGVTNSAYWVVKGVDLPELASEARAAATEVSQLLRLRFRLTLEPIAHAGALTTYAPTAITTTFGGTDFSQAAPTGDMSAPASITIKKTNIDNVWEEIFLATCPAATTVYELTGTADAAASGGAALPAIANGISNLITSIEHMSAVDGQYSQRVIMRAKVTAGDPLKLQLRMGYHTGLNVVGPIIISDWAPFTYIVGSYFLLDLGIIPARPIIQDRVVSGTLTTMIFLYSQTTDASTVDFQVDAIEVVPYHGFVKLRTSSLSSGYSVVYDQTSRSGSFYWPRQAPASYKILASTGVYHNPVSRYGALAPLPAGQIPWFWVQGQSAYAHLLSDTAEVGISYLPSYSLGLRGAA